MKDNRRAYLECPCCGDEGAESDERGLFYDGQPLICGCPGLVSIDTDDTAWINNGDEPCLKCSRGHAMSEQRERTPSEIVRDIADFPITGVPKSLAAASVALLACADAYDREQQRTRETCASCASWTGPVYPNGSGGCISDEFGCTSDGDTPVTAPSHSCAAYTPKEEPTNG